MPPSPAFIGISSSCDGGNVAKREATASRSAEGENPLTIDNVAKREATASRSTYWQFARLWANVAKREATASRSENILLTTDS